MDAWNLVQQLVRIDSSDPGAYEDEIETFIKQLVSQRVEELPRHLADQILIEELEVLPARRDLRIHVPGTGDEPALVYICHMDTVTLGEGWADDTPPLGAIVRDGRLFGRGSCDMKSGLACAICALMDLLDRMGETGSLPRRAFSLICTVDEEDQMRGVEAAIRAGWVGSTEWALDTEPTDGQIQVAHKGRTWFELTVKGITAHASQPWQGADAIAAAAKAICQIRQEFSRLPAHEELGPATVTFGQIEDGYQPYVVPDSCTVWVDMRLVPPTTTDDARAIVERAIATAESAVPGTKGSYRITGDRPAIERDPDSPLLAALSQTVEDVTGTAACVGFFTGYTDTAVIAGTCANRTCLSYGPGSLALAHKPNEFVPKADVERCEQVLTELSRRLLW